MGSDDSVSAFPEGDNLFSWIGSITGAATNWVPDLLNPVPSEGATAEFCGLCIIYVDNSGPGRLIWDCVRWPCVQALNQVSIWPRRWAICPHVFSASVAPFSPTHILFLSQPLRHADKQAALVSHLSSVSCLELRVCDESTTLHILHFVSQIAWSSSVI